MGISGTLSIFGVNTAVVRFLAPEANGESASGWGAAKASLNLTVVFSAVVSLALVITALYLLDYFMKSPLWS